MQWQDVIEYTQDRKAFKSLLNLQILPPAGSKQTSVQMAAFLLVDLPVKSVMSHCTIENYNSLYCSSVKISNLTGQKLLINFL